MKISQIKARIYESQLAFENLDLDSVSDLLEINKNLEQQVDDLQKEIDKFSAEIQENTDSNVNYANNIILVQLEKQLHCLKSEIKRLTAHLPKQPESSKNSQTSNSLESILSINSIENDTECSQTTDLKNESVSQTFSLEQPSISKRALSNKITNLEKEVENLRELKIIDNTELSHLKQLIVHQEQELQEAKQKNTNLEKNIKDLQELIDEPSDQQSKLIIHQLKTQITDLQDENVCLRKCLTSTSPEEEKVAFMDLELRGNKLLQDEIKSLRSELDSYKNLQCDLFKISHTVNSAGDVILDPEITDRIDELKTKVSDLQNELETTKRETNDLTEKLNDRNNRITHLELKLDELREENNNLCKSLQEKSRRYSEQETDLTEEITKLKLIIQHSEIENQSLLNEKINLENKLNTDLRTIHETAERKVKLSEKVIHRLDSDKKELEDKLIIMKKEQQDILLRLEQYVHRGTVQETELENEIRQLKQHVYELEESKSSLEHKLNNTKELVNKSAAQKIKNLEFKITKLESNRSHLLSRIDKMSIEQDELTEKLHKKIITNSTQESSLELELYKLKSSLAEKKGQIKDLEYNFFQLEAKNLERTEYDHQKISDLEMRVEELNIKNATLQTEIDNMKKENEKFQQKFQKLKAQSNQIRNNMAVRREESRNSGTKRSISLSEKGQLDAIKKESQGNYKKRVYIH